MLKKTTLAIFGLAVSTYASTGVCGTMGPVCTPGNVTVPCEATQWDVGVQGLYFKPTYNADRGYEFRNLSTLAKADPDWDWGYKLHGAYHFNTGNDISLSWIHYHVVSNLNNFAGRTLLAPIALPYQLYLANTFDQVNVTLGQHVDMSDRKMMRFYGGMQYAKIRVEDTHHYNQLPSAIRASGTTQINRFRDSQYYGVGPTIGADYAYALYEGLSVTANSAISILYGNSRYNEGYSFDPSGLVIYPAAHSQKALVPSFEAKLGLNYGYQIAEGTLNVEGGYQAINYFDAFQTRGQLGLASNKGSSNFGLYGPYVGAKWVGNV